MFNPFVIATKPKLKLVIQEMIKFTQLFSV